MNTEIKNRVVANMERLAETTLNYAKQTGDAEVALEGRFYRTLAKRIMSMGVSAGDIIPGVAENEEYDTYVGAGGYVMSYDPTSGGRGKRVVQQLTLKGELVNEFPSIDAAAEALGCSPGSISSVAAGRTHMTKGHVFRYKRF